MWASLWGLDPKFPLTDDNLPPGCQEATPNQNVSNQTHSLFSSFESVLLFFLCSLELYPPTPLGRLQFPSLPAWTMPPSPHTSPLRQRQRQLPHRPLCLHPISTFKSIFHTVIPKRWPEHVTSFLLKIQGIHSLVCLHLWSS